MAWKFKIKSKSEVDNTGAFEVTGDIINKDNGEIVSSYPNYTFRVNSKAGIVNSATLILNSIKDARREINKLSVDEEIDL